jgi:hypothetical protein
VVDKMAAYKKGQVLKFSKKSDMEKELAKVRETRRAYPSGKRGEWKIKVGIAKKSKAPKTKKGGRKGKRR